MLIINPSSQNKMEIIAVYSVMKGKKKGLGGGGLGGEENTVLARMEELICNITFAGLKYILHSLPLMLLSFWSLNQNM